MVDGVVVGAGKHSPRRSNGLSDLSAVAFDAYGTLIAFNDADFVATMARICESQGLVADGAEVWKRFLRSAIAFQKRRRAQNGHHNDGISHWRYGDTWPVHFTNVFRQLKLDGDPLAATEFLRDTLAKAQAYPDARHVIDSVRKSYPVALLSNADDNFLLPCLEANGLTFDMVITSEQVQSMKPEPAIFQYLADRMETDPASILYVGDSPIADVLGAREAGLKVAWVNRFGLRKPRIAPQPDLRLRSLSDLLPLLDVA